MNTNYIVRKSQNKILYFELLVLSIVVAIFIMNYFKLYPALGALIGLFVTSVFFLIFFSARLFRYFFLVPFSFGWGYAAFLSSSFFYISSTTIAWSFAVIAFIISVILHYFHFKFLRDVNVHIYDAK